MKQRRFPTLNILHRRITYWEKSACNSNVLLVIFRTAVYSNLGLLFYISVFYTNYLLTEALLFYFSYFIFHELQIPYRIVNNTNGSKYSFGKQHHDKYLFQLCTPTYYGYRIIGESAWGGGGSVLISGSGGMGWDLEIFMTYKEKGYL